MTNTEHYQIRGIGSNWLPCYICNSLERRAQPDMAAFVEDEASGERVLLMYKSQGLHAELDFRPSEPNWVQIKVGACNKHLPNLKKLQKLCSEDNQITPLRITESLAD